MRTARLVGLSPDGGFLLVLSDQGEQFAVAADDRLRAAVCGDRPRLGPRETQMETSLSPREIQTRIRVGASVQDVIQMSGMPADRVERFAAPVLAEREHIAATAGSSSVRRRGETSGHRTLRSTVHEYLRGQDVDLDTVAWDASRREDGRWSVTVDVGDGPGVRRATFFYDLQGRFSVAGDDQARALLGERSARQPEPVPAQDSADTEATVGLDDELALIRATQEPRSATDGLLSGSEPVDGSSEEPPEELTEELTDDSTAELRAEAAEPTVAVLRRVVGTEVTQVTELTEVAEGERRPPAESTETASGLDALYDMLGGDGYAEDSIRIYAGLSDASAVPEVDAHAFEPAATGLDFPVEPGTDPDEETSEPRGEDVAPSEPRAAASTPESEQELDEEPEALIPGPAPAKKAVRRKRASVPSWDEIMFGGPKRGS